MHKVTSVRIEPVEMPRWLWLALAICLAGHVWLGFTLGLSVDEAHYALYALHPALSYFDHPPLVGWVQIPFVWFDGSDWMMRIVSLALWGVTAWALWRFSKWALVLFLLSPIHQLLGLALVPDSLLLPLTLWVMVLTWKLSHDITCKSCWLWLGVALGLSGLAKYTGVFLALGVAIVLLPRYGITLLQQRGVWIAALIVGVLISPVFIWNAQNSWTSFYYQINHATGMQEWRITKVLGFELIQLLAYGAWPLIGFVMFVWKLQAQHRQLARISFAFGLPILLFTAYSAGRNAALPHWTASAWLALLPAAALGLRRLWKVGLVAKFTLIGLGLLQAVSIMVLVFFMHTGGRWQEIPLLRYGNPFTDFYDWKEAALKAHAIQKETGLSALAVSNWTLASRLAWYARAEGASESSVKVWALDGKNKQFDMWFGNLEYGQSFIWVDWSQMPMKKPVGCQKLEGKSHQGKYSSFDFYKCGRV